MHKIGYLFIYTLYQKGNWIMYPAMFLCLKQNRASSAIVCNRNVHSALWEINQSTTAQMYDGQGHITALDSLKVMAIRD